MNADLVPLIFLVIGLALAVGGIYWLQRTRQFVAGATQTTGQIVSVAAPPSRTYHPTNRTWAPVIRFRDAVGREVTFTSNFSTSGMQSRIGERVPVLYDPQDSSQAQMGGGFPLYAGPAIVLVIGLGFSAFGLGFLANTGKLFARLAQATAPRGDAGLLAGHWANVDPRTSSITRVDISGGGVRIWGRCHPQDCDWGAPASYDRVDGAVGTMTLSWDHKFARRSQQLALLPDGRLQVTTQTHFVDRSGRADREMTDYFARAAK